MNPRRSFLAQALAALLLLQWGGAPAHCLAMVASALGSTVICHAENGAPPHDGVPVSPDQSCPACHALGHAALTPTPPAMPELIAWSAPTPPGPRPAANPVTPRAPPQQPRAPPAHSV